ncbi:MAG: RtcB family protein, partial [Candidatus Pacearchaeota archaeon]
DLERIGVKSGLISRTRDHKIQTRYDLREFSATNHELHIYSKEFIDLLIKAGMPIGNKTRQEVKIPEWIKSSNKLIKRLFLAGFFGAEMSSPKTSSKTSFFCPTIDQNKIENLSQNMRDFLIDISLILEEFGIKNTKISEFDDFKNKYGEKTKRFRLFVKGEEDMLKLWRNIGFEYNQKRQNLANIASLYILLKNKENKKRQEIARKVKEYKLKGFKLAEVQKIFEKKINVRFIERHYYENAKQRINLDFISFEDFKKQKLEEIKEFGAIFDKVESITNIKGTYKVYDFNMQDNHNFIANGFIVSNCGVRLLSTNIKVSEFLKKRKEVLHDIFRTVPSGVGRGGEKYSRDEILEVLKKGAEWAVEKGMGIKEDLEHIEENGRMKNANPADVSQRAINRGLPQLGTLGAGNHFLEIQKIDKIFDDKIASAFGLDKENITIMIHCGSRGLGHQVASDYIMLMENKYGFANLPDRELINAPIKSELGQKYLSAMNCAVNFAFCNRQMIMHHVRQVMKRHFPKSEVKLIYDVCHNIAKIEEFEVDGKKMTLCVHRKGATRSFGPGRKEIPAVFRKIGQPVLIPGSMGTASYVLVGTKKAEEITFGSTAHGSGRVESRAKAKRELTPEEIQKELKVKDILLETLSRKAIVEEAPEAYKDIDEVVRVSHEAGIGNLVARVVPIAVMKG